MNYDEIFQHNNFFRNVSEHEEEEEEFRFQEALRALAPKNETCVNYSHNLNYRSDCLLLGL